MDAADLETLVEDLSGNIDDLETVLAPLLKTPLAQSTSKLPLLDKAKTYVLATYAIESILFSYLRLNGVEAKSHPVFQELARVKEYLGKIKAAETAGTKRTTVIDKEAAGRFIRHGLAGNDKYDRERIGRVAVERAGAKRKLEEIAVGKYTRFDGMAKKVKESDEPGQEAAVARAQVELSDGSRKEPGNATPDTDARSTTSDRKKKGKSKKRHRDK